MTWMPEKRMERAQYNLEWRRANPTNHSNWVARILPFIKHRAKKKKIPFTITPADVTMPSMCPILKVPFVIGRMAGRNHPHSPSLDRLRPELGYIPGNVAVISLRANIVKSDASAAEVQAIATWMVEQGL